MVRFEIKVPNHDDGASLGTFAADALPRAGDSFVIFHPRLGKEAFVAKVDVVCWEAFAKGHDYATNKEGTAEATVWLVEESTAPTFYCTCTVKSVDDSGNCTNCGDRRQ